MRYALVLTAIVGVLFIVPVIMPTDPMSTNPAAQMMPPSSLHIFGTDVLGRDVFIRAFYGGQRTLSIAALAAILAAVIGIPVGLTMGWSSGAVARIIDAVVNAVLAFPGLLLALVILALLGRGYGSLVLAVGFTQIAPFTLVTRSSILTIRSTTYVEAAEALGANRRHITKQHLLPNIMPTLLAYLGVTFAYSIINGAALSFLGLGGELGVPDWGAMLAEGRTVIRDAPWISIVPGLAITITVIVVNSLIDRITAQST
jgi:ABC-type dipeptide/oligopeptide/nickel transport system permease subunit